MEEKNKNGILRSMAFAALVLVMILCAAWGIAGCGQETAETGAHSVVFSYNYNGAPEAIVQYVDDAETAEKPAETPVRDGYVFLYWATDVTGQTEYDFDEPVTENIRLFAAWQMTVATVKFELNNGESRIVIKTDVGTAVSAPTNDDVNGDGDTTEYTPERRKYEFTGWYSDASCTTEYDFNQPISRNTTIYAGWNQVEADVTYYYYEGYEYNDSYETVDIGTTLTAPVEDPEREDYEFTGWYADRYFTEEFDFTAPVTGDVTIYAGWKQTVATVTLDPNYDGGTATAQKVDIGKSLDDLEGLEVPERYGYEFGAWYEDASCSTLYDTSAGITGDITLYAGWKIRTFTVTFSLGYGTDAPVTQQVEYMSAATEPAEPTRDGYIFLGWYTESGELYDADPITEDTTLTAQWEEESGDTGDAIIITYSLNYSGGGTYYSQEVTSGTRLSTTQPADPERTGYYFGGWYTDEACTTTPTWSTRVTSSVRLYAQWLQTYTFEAEYTDLYNMQWNGTSDNGTGNSNGTLGASIEAASRMTNASELASNVSNGYFVQKMFYNGATLEFHITSSAAVSNAVLELRLSPDLYDLMFAGTQYYKITINDTQTFYLDYDLTGAIGENNNGLNNKRLFDNYFITGEVNLVEGDNVIKLIVNNTLAHTGTVWAEAPLVDCIYVSSSSTLSWTSGYCFPELVGQTMSDVNYSVSVTTSYTSLTSLSLACMPPASLAGNGKDVDISSLEVTECNAAAAKEEAKEAAEAEAAANAAKEASNED